MVFLKREIHIRNINNIDIAIVPAVGVDGNLQRIGFGKGMYDRFFEKLQEETIYNFCATGVLLYTINLFVTLMMSHG